MTVVALVGNPNCGKTTLFNALTGTHQRVGNWPGVTVERKSGTFTHLGETIEVVDLPGTYSISPVGTGLDEKIARTFLNERQADVVINIVDAAALSRGLYLTNELAALGLPVVFVANMLDVAAGQGAELDLDLLAARLGCPVIGMVASRQQGLQDVKSALHDAQVPQPIAQVGDDEASVYTRIDSLVSAVTRHGEHRRIISEKRPFRLLDFR